VKVADQKLRQAERDTGHEAGRPHAQHAAPADLRRHQPERNDDGDQTELAAHHRAQREFVEAGDFVQRDDGNADGAERDRRGVADERELRGFERAKAEPDDQCAGNGDRRTEIPRSLR